MAVNGLARDRLAGRRRCCADGSALAVLWAIEDFVRYIYGQGYSCGI